MNNKILWASFACATMMTLSSCTTSGTFGNSKFGKIVDAGLNKIEAGVDTVVGKFSGNGGAIDKKIMEQTTKALAPACGLVSNAVKKGVDPRNAHFNKELNSALKQIERSHGPEVKAIVSKYVTDTFDAKHAVEKGLPTGRIERELQARKNMAQDVAKHYVEKAAKDKVDGLTGKAGEAFKRGLTGETVQRELKKEFVNKIPFGGLILEVFTSDKDTKAPKPQ